jgi:3-hydroxypropanoate dehydrogenase
MTETLDAAQATKIADHSLDQIFRQARTHNAWLPKRVPVKALHEAYNLARYGPTSANSSPARFVFLESEAAKARLLPALAPPNVEKTKAAPVTAIIAWDTEFYEKLPQLFPHADMRSYFVGDQKLAEETAFRNSTLQGGYFILAARAVGLDCGPMSGFDAAKVNANGRLIFSAISATAIRVSYSRAVHVLNLRRPAACCDAVMRRARSLRRSRRSLHTYRIHPMGNST